MKTPFFLLGLLALPGLAWAPAVRSFEPGGAPQDSPSQMARTRFLFLAVFEGLWEDGVDPAPLKAIVAKRFDHFVGKCPICMPVSHAFAVYAYSSDTDVYPSRGKGLSQDLSDDLKSPDRPKRLRAIQTLVDRYVERRFERSKMTDEEKNNMQNLLLMGKKLGSSVKDQKFGESCPSCEGATKGK